MTGGAEIKQNKENNNNSRSLIGIVNVPATGESTQIELIHTDIYK